MNNDKKNEKEKKKLYGFEAHIFHSNRDTLVW